jgi:biopolymer transport protein ExbB/TolQ
MKNGVYSILKARFLINEEANAAKNWRFIVFLILLAIIMIANNNNIDQKVFKIIQLTGEVKELRSEFVDRRSELMKLKMESTVTQKMIEKGIMRIGKPLDAIEKSMENVGKLEMYSMERNLNILSLVSGIAPMFGFLGTIIGMVQLFYGIASTGEYTLNTIAGGIYTKMITSATGLIIGLIAYVGHNFLSTQIDKTANKMERASADFLDILQEPTQA